MLGGDGAVLGAGLRSSGRDCDCCVPRLLVRHGLSERGVGV